MNKTRVRETQPCIGPSSQQLDMSAPLLTDCGHGELDKVAFRELGCIREAEIQPSYDELTSEEIFEREMERGCKCDTTPRLWKGRSAQ